jgi:hypothetical protein
MTDYEFTLKFALPSPQADGEAYVVALNESGCDDALIGVGKKGRIALEFIRSAASAETAITSALQDVLKTIPGAKLIEADPDLVGLSELAELMGCSRQNMRKTVLADAEFPTPLHEGSPALFHLVEVFNWIEQKKQERVDPIALEVARTTMQVNLAKEVRKLPNMQLSKEILAAC